MNSRTLILIPAIAISLAMTGCASKKTVDPTKIGLGSDTSTPINTGNNTGAANGGNTTGLGNTDGLATTTLDPAMAAANAAAENLRKALSTRVVHFDYDSSQLSAENLAILNAHARYLAQTSNAKVTLAGHTDERGTREYNMALGERRALAVQTFLLTNGAKASQLDTVSYGKEVPVNEASTEAAWAENRRVELKYDAAAPTP